MHLVTITTLPDPVQVLGEIAASCDLYATDPTLRAYERRELDLRAEAYRKQQEIQMEFWEKENE